MIPELLDIKDPPTTAINIKYKFRLLSELINDSPELLKLLRSKLLSGQRATGGSDALLHFLGGKCDRLCCHFKSLSDCLTI